MELVWQHIVNGKSVAEFASQADADKARKTLGAGRTQQVYRKKRA